MFTFSVHCGKNFPLRKQQSDLDISVQDGLEDKEYLSTGTSTQAIITNVICVHVFKVKSVNLILSTELIKFVRLSFFVTFVCYLLVSEEV